MTRATVSLPAGLDGAFAAAGAAAWGGVPYRRLTPMMAERDRAQAAHLCPNPTSVLVAAFPYYAGDRPGNLSLYARGEDYHRVLGRKLSTVCNFLASEYPLYSFYPSADSSPLPERQAAWLAGLGLRGENGLVILPPYGSYVFLGTILTDAPFALDAAAPSPGCGACGRCRAACPTGALGAAGLCPDRCLSDLTQRKGGLTAAESAHLARHPLVWGCDSCQRVCPYNAGAAQTALPEFREHLTDTLTPALVAGLTNRDFRARYGDRAFAWRGPAVLRRNLALKKAETPGVPPPDEV